MKAIPTDYNGYHFRSRLEATWACFRRVDSARRWARAWKHIARLYSQVFDMQEARIAELEEALRPFAELADNLDGKDTDYVPCSMLCGDFNHARKVLDHE